jgi:hypothetical protein
MSAATRRQVADERTGEGYRTPNRCRRRSIRVSVVAGPPQDPNIPPNPPTPPAPPSATRNILIVVGVIVGLMLLWFIALSWGFNRVG